MASIATAGKQAESGRSRLLNRRELAAAFSVNPQVVTAWQNDGMPVAERGGPRKQSLFDLASVNAWWVQRKLGKFTEHGNNGQPISLEVERAKLARAQTEKAELDAAARKGELVPVEDTLEAMATVANAVKAKILAIPRAVAAQLAGMSEPAAVEAALRAKMLEALGELAGWTAPKSRGKKTA